MKDRIATAVVKSTLVKWTSGRDQGIRLAKRNQEFLSLFNYSINER
jgi:hypothetical protein